MLTKDEKELLARAEATVNRNSGGGLEKYLNPQFREEIRSDQARTAWAIHFYRELAQQSETPVTMEMGLLEEAYELANAAVAYDRLGPDAFNKEKYLRIRQLGEEFTQLLQRYRMRLTEPSIKIIVLKMAQEICAA